jgi:hypothetical protein
MVVNNEGTTQSIFHEMTRWYASPLFFLFFYFNINNLLRGA